MPPIAQMTQQEQTFRNILLSLMMYERSDRTEKDYQWTRAIIVDEVTKSRFKSREWREWLKRNDFMGEGA